jgi:hypothetical protein
MTFAFAMVGANAALAAGPFECPTKPLESPELAKITELLPTGDSFEKVERLNNAVTTLKAEGVSPPILIDNLIASYCPQIAAEKQLTDAQKSARVNRFAARITRTVYSLDSADEIILDVGFPPAVISAINDKSHASGVTPEIWIQSAVEAALK